MRDSLQFFCLAGGEKVRHGDRETIDLFRHHALSGKGTEDVVKCCRVASADMPGGGV